VRQDIATMPHTAFGLVDASQQHAKQVLVPCMVSATA
jgi:hypothetical protein